MRKVVNTWSHLELQYSYISSYMSRIYKGVDQSSRKKSLSTLVMNLLTVTCLFSVSPPRHCSIKDEYFPRSHLEQEVVPFNISQLSCHLILSFCHQRGCTDLKWLDSVRYHLLLLKSELRERGGSFFCSVTHTINTSYSNSDFKKKKF